MLPIEVPNEVERAGLVKIIYGPPEGVSEEDCGYLETLQGTFLGGIFDGSPAIVSYWQPDAEELKMLLEGNRPIELVILLPVCPLIQLNVI